MGITIAYSGKLADPKLVGKFVEDMTEKAKKAGWQFISMEELVAEGRVKSKDLRGITLFPHPECEWLSFHLDAEGVFVNHFYHSMLTNAEHLAMVTEALRESMSLMRVELPAKKSKAKAKGAGSKAKAKPAPDVPPSISPKFIEEGRRYNWTKTQFAGADVHIAVCALLRYIKQRYAPDLQIDDDSGYFETGDWEKLEGQLAQVERVISITKEAFEGAARSGKSPTSLSGFVDLLNEELASANEKLH